MPATLTPGSALIRYCLLQTPGVLFVSVLATLAVIETFIRIPTAVLIVLAWLVKDAALYPLYRKVLQAPLPAIGTHALLGHETELVKPLVPRGVVRIDGERWLARTRDDRHIAAGERVRVIDADGLVLVVERVGRSDRT